jgi:hypothetical protein
LACLKGANSGRNATVPGAFWHGYVVIKASRSAFIVSACVVGRKDANRAFGFGFAKTFEPIPRS